MGKESPNKRRQQPSSSAGSPNKRRQVDPEVREYLEEYKHKNKLLYRWDKYFPHETVREYDVSLHTY